MVLAGQAPTMFGGLLLVPLMDAETGPAVERFGRHYFDHDHAEYLEMIAPAWHVPDVTTDWWRGNWPNPQADTFSTKSGASTPPPPGRP